MAERFDNRRMIMMNQPPDGYNGKDMFDAKGSKVVSVDSVLPNGRRITQWAVYPACDADYRGYYIQELYSDTTD